MPAATKKSGSHRGDRTQKAQRRPRTPRNQRRARSRPRPPVGDYAGFSELTGPITDPPEGRPYKVEYRRIHRTRREWLTTRLLVLAAVSLDLWFVWWLLSDPSHYPTNTGPQAIQFLPLHFVIPALTLLFMKWCLTVAALFMQVFLLCNVVAVGRASLAARDPIPVTPPQGMRVAFLTTIVPSKEPIEMAETTLLAAKKIRYDGGPGSKFDVWLLDEGGLDENGRSPVKDMCDRIGVNYFTRKNASWIVHRQGVFQIKSKHGNHNEWLGRHGQDYDFVMFVDTDHVPFENMAENMLGYFRDPDVAFVIGPQFYGNTQYRVARLAESAQYLFHSIIQRAGNRRRSAMLVGTSAAVRLSAIREGYIGSITEDLATSFDVHTRRNPETGNRWESVYIPNATAVGEGPSSFTEFYQQQDRWAGGTYHALKHQIWRGFFRLRPGAMLHYGLMLTYYPSVALGWLIGFVVSASSLGLGIQSLHTDAGWWVTYYADVAVLQFFLYWYMRRHNVSPHEYSGTSGFTGMLLSALTTPIYARSFIRVGVGKTGGFKTTAKGTTENPDTIGTFRYHLMWAGGISLCLAAALARHQALNPLMVGWAVVLLAICLTPVAISFWDRAREQKGRISVPEARLVTATAPAIAPAAAAGADDETIVINRAMAVENDDTVEFDRAELERMLANAYARDRSYPYTREKVAL